MSNKHYEQNSIKAFRVGGLELFQHFDKKLGLSEIIGKHKTKGALIVYDKGVDSKDNRKLIRSAKMHFLTACKMHEPMKEKIRKHIAELQPVLKHKSGEQIKAA